MTSSKASVGRTLTTLDGTNTYYNYFAFGSNMASSTMTALRNLEPVISTAAVLPGHRLAFNVPGTPLIEPSWASVEPIQDLGKGSEISSHNNVHGVLYKLTERDFLDICKTEGVPFGYTLHRCRVIPYKGNGDAAGEDALRTYFRQRETGGNKKEPSDSTCGTSSTDSSIFAFTLRASREQWRKAKDTSPSRAYLNVLIRGAEEYQLDQQYQQYLKAIPPGRTLAGDGLAEMMLDAAERRSSSR